jgi:DNA mismatch repair protein MutH
LTRRRATLDPTPDAAPPASEQELVERARRLAGRHLGDLADELGVAVPADLRGHKGWVGHLMERALGASAHGRDAPDFEALGIELKTIPVDRRGKALETTFVCTIPLAQMGDVPWERSRVRRKLAQVMWLPVEAEAQLPLRQRRVGAAVLWRLTPEHERALRLDWEEIAGVIGRGAVDSLTGRVGRFLQVRPKAANARVRTRTIDAEGVLYDTLPRGFYLRTSFTQAILDEAFGLARVGPGRMDRGGSDSGIGS